MRVFISWSGNKSRMFAEAFKPWLEQVLPGTDVWLSSEDIDKGTIWFTEIINELGNCNCGVLCITRENFLAPWIHFEAGGMCRLSILLTPSAQIELTPSGIHNSALRSIHLI